MIFDDAAQPVMLGGPSATAPGVSTSIPLYAKDEGIPRYFFDALTPAIPRGWNYWDGTKWQPLGGSGFGPNTDAGQVSILYVDGATTLTTAEQSGNVEAPFKTIAQANAFITANPARFLAGAAIVLSLGTYVERIVEPNIPMATYVVIGYDAAGTVVRDNTAGAVFTAAPTAGNLVAAARIANVTLQQQNALGSVIAADGSGLGAASGFWQTLEMENVRIVTAGGGAVFKCMGILLATGGIWAGTTTFQEVSSSSIRGTTLGALDIRWDSTATLPLAGLGTCVFSGRTTAAGVILRNQATVAFDKTTQLTSVTGTGLSVSGTTGPTITFQGTISGAWTMNGASSLPTPAGGAVNTVNLDGARWLPGSTLLLAQTALGTGRTVISARGATYEMTAASSISVGGSVDLIMLSSAFNEGALVVASTGAIDRDQATKASAAYPTNTPLAQTWAVPFPATKTAADFAFTISPSVWSATNSGWVISAVSETGFTMSGVTAGATFTAVVTARRVTGVS